MTHLSDGTSVDVTSGTQWTLSNSALATVSNGALTAKAPGTLTVQAAYVAAAGTNPSSDLSASTQVTITPASAPGAVNVPLITWNTPATISYGTTLSSAQLSATGNVGGTFTYSPAAGSLLKAGTHTLSTTFTPTDTKTYSVATASVLLTVNPATPVITWAPPATAAAGTTLGATQLDASANVPGSFVYSPAAGAVLATGTQQLTAVFSPSDNTDYSPATARTSLVVNAASADPTENVPVVTWNPPAAISYGTALSSTQLSATANVPGIFAYTPAAGTIPKAGTQKLSTTFTPTDAKTYSSTTASVQLTVNKAKPMITWNATQPRDCDQEPRSARPSWMPPRNMPGRTLHLQPGCRRGSGGGHAAINGPVFTCRRYRRLLRHGTRLTGCEPIILGFDEAVPVITWNAPATISYGTILSSAQLSARANVPGTFTYTPAAGTMLRAGTHTLYVTFTPTNTKAESVTTASAHLTVHPASPEVTWSTPTAIAAGTALSAAQLDAAANVPGRFTYSLVAGVVLAAGTQPLTAVFYPSDSTDYSSATAHSAGCEPIPTWGSHYHLECASDHLGYGNKPEQYSIGCRGKRTGPVHLQPGGGGGSGGGDTTINGRVFSHRQHRLFVSHGAQLDRGQLSTRKP